MAYVYLVYDYDEGGPEQMRATFDRKQLPDLVESFFDPAKPPSWANDEKSLSLWRARMGEEKAEVFGRLPGALALSDAELEVGAALSGGHGAVTIRAVRLSP